MTVTPDAAPTPAPTPTPTPAAAPPAGSVFNASRYFALGLLLIVYISNYADRQILNVLAKQIMEDLQLSKTAFGILAGPTFALFYATLGVPIAMLADRASRKWILVASLSIWSVMTTFCGFAGSYWQLALARIGVGFGEAGGSPPSHSMIADLYPAERRGTALAVYSLGVPLGIFLGSIVGGQIGSAFGWRAAFLVLGIPGLLLAAYVTYAFQEPPRGHSDATTAATDKPATLAEVARFMWSQNSLFHTIVGGTLVTAVGYGSVTWTAVFLQSSHGMTLTAASTYLGFQTGLVAGIGTFFGGYLADYLAKQHHIGWSAWIVTAAIVFSIPFTFVIYLSGDRATVLWVMTATILVGGVYLAPTFALVQNLVPTRMRSTAAALLLFLINLIGLGLGPLLVGAIADFFDWSHMVPAKDSVRYALFVFSAIGLWGGWHYYIAPRTLKADLERATTA